MECTVDEETPNWVDLALGRTPIVANRGKGYGTILRAACVVAAKRAGYTKVTQMSAYINGAQPEHGKTPQSASIMKRIGFSSPIPPRLNNQGRVIGIYHEMNLKNNRAFGKSLSVLSPPRPSCLSCFKKK
jgi:hypothetical protein